ncbi:MAG: 1-(5-phosphoribosyl)-5-((5-phosphoribosylamino)methylideneamino)imidazole-4-carboxamide isomerase [Betaproteobacteria bacterium AqS2]|uniref:1-(5-phosphoribosyl)-5-[(5-phosphoribosylamino)methylideneamino] imidazole-4-carboxamide isomerase n=1 Tax=Candidatus Amphirhobacter heronislandensis TaxID=1732024 RepID=A0A930Y2C6_9GAMM|nr:1-(5-phosphoribosyl)-5-((5-phosphoribosylamino)methylideneamino)imidazole-4-carboxamide isomerase [Betaproteobacteria bacterium AqS2]
MDFLPIPAIDLLDGNVVRLREGDYGAATVYGASPAEQAASFARHGARRLHLVDLDGARRGAPANRAGVAAAIDAAKKENPAIEVQVGGGLRDLAAIEACLEAADYAIVGTAAVADEGFLAAACERWPRRIILGLDARDGSLAVNGWEQDAAVRTLDFAARVKELPLAAVAHTDIARDGTLQGPNLEASAELQQLLACPVIASGGVAALADVEEARKAGLGGAIVGKALYENRIGIAELLAA